VHGLEVQARGQVLLLVAGAQIAGLLGWGALAHRFKTRKRPVVASAVLAVSALCTLAAFPGLPLPAATALLSLVAIGVACVPILVAHGKESFAPHLLGRGITVLNLANMGGVFVMQMATAQVIAWLDGPAHGVVHALDAYRGMFLFIAATLAAALALYAAAPEGQHRSPH
jgi:MFS family permease